jgi:hypothetical protein
VKDRGDDFLAAVGHLQSDPAKWRQLSLAARETVLQRYSIEEGARQWIDLLEHLNKQKSASGDFRAPRVLRLPRPNPKSGWLEQPWESGVKDYIRSVPPLYRMAKATVSVPRKLG